SIMSILSMHLFLQCCSILSIYLILSFFFNATATTEIYTLSLHDALPILALPKSREDIRLLVKLAQMHHIPLIPRTAGTSLAGHVDRKSTRLNSSHVKISYAVFCLKKKIKNQN